MIMIIIMITIMNLFFADDEEKGIRRVDYDCDYDYYYN